MSDNSIPVAYEECNICVGGTTGIASAPRDCSGKCIDDTNKDNSCVSKDNVMCDGQKGSTAYLD